MGEEEWEGMWKKKGGNERHTKPVEWGRAGNREETQSSCHGRKERIRVHTILLTLGGRGIYEDIRDLQSLKYGERERMRDTQSPWNIIQW